MNEEKGYGLLVSAIVAIVAVVGMVVLFSQGAPTGAVVMQGGPALFKTEMSDPQPFRDNSCTSGVGLQYADGRVKCAAQIPTFAQSVERAGRDTGYFDAEEGVTIPGIDSGDTNFNYGYSTERAKNKVYPEKINY